MSAVAVLLLSASIVAPTESPTIPESKLRDFVRQLGDKSYRVRETAAQALLKGGASSVSVLQEGTKDIDAEISERCRLLLPMAASLERNEKLAQLVKDPNAQPPTGLAGVERFLKVTGDSKEARELYAEMLAVHHDIIEKCDKEPQKASELLGRFADEAYNRWQAGTRMGRYTYDNMFQNRPDMTMFFFVSSDTTLPKNANIASRGQMLLNDTKIPGALSSTGTDSSPVFKKIFVSWLENEQTPYMQSRGFQIAANANLKEALPVAKKLLGKKELTGYNHSQIMIAFVKFNEKEMIKDLEPFVDRKAVVTTVNFGNGGQKTVQVGDVALGVIIQLHGQKPEEFGYDTRGNAQVMASSYIYYGFGSDKEREDSRAKWKVWSDKNLKKK